MSIRFTPALVGFLAITSVAIPSEVFSLQGDLEPRDRERHAFHMRGEELYRGRNPFQLHAIELPELMAVESPDEQISLMHDVAKVGGNAFLVPLLCREGEVAEAFMPRFEPLLEIAREKSFAILLDLTAPCRETGEPPSIDLVHQLAGTLRDRWEAIYILPDSHEHLRAFRQSAPDLVSASFGGSSDLRMASGTEEPEASHILHVLSEPEALPSLHHFILPVGEKSLQLLEKKYGASMDGWQTRWEAAQQGFIPAFPEGGFTGWTITGDPELWSIHGDVVIWRGRGGRYLRSNPRFQNFILRLEWQIGTGGNSGVFLHMPAAGRGSRIGMEIQLLGDYGTAPNKNGTGAIYDIAAPTVNASKPTGEWNSLQILRQESRLEVVMNGEVIHDLDMDAHPTLKNRLRDGFLAFQDHGTPVAFRNVEIKILP